MQHSKKRTCSHRSKGAVVAIIDVPTGTKHCSTTAFEPVRIPTGYFPIEIIQSWRRESECKSSLHWAIVVRTSKRYGDRHELIGDTYTYTKRNRLDFPLDPCKDWLGNLIVGFVRPDKVDQLSERIKSIPVRCQQPTWTDRNWVWEVLYGLNDDYLYTDDEMLLTALQTHMCRMFEAWELGEI